MQLVLTNEHSVYNRKTYAIYSEMPKEDIIPKLIPVFRNYGYEGATVSRLSQATGLKKASLYHHFQGGKEQMAEAALAYVGEWLEANIFAPLKSSKPASERLQDMIQHLAKFYGQGQTPCLLAVMSLGEADNIFHRQLDSSLQKWLNEFTKLAQETGISSAEAKTRAEDAMIAIQGSLVVARVSNDPQPFQRAIAKLPQILLPTST